MRIKLPKPVGIVWIISGARLKARIPGVTFHIPSHSWDDAERQAEHLSRDMRCSVRLRQAWEFRPGHIGLGAAGIRRAKYGAKG